MALGEKIKRLRKERRWLQGDLAEKVGVHNTHISRLETDRYTPSLELLRKLAEVFDVSIDYLLSERVEDEVVLKLGGSPLSERIKLVEQLDEQDQNVILGVIDAFLTKRKVWEALRAQSAA
jgi:transcriptional regulator with XRE-family HTH domain